MKYLKIFFSFTVVLLLLCHIHSLIQFRNIAYKRKDGVLAVPLGTLGK